MKRNLTDDDVKALITEAKKQIFHYTGKGVWRLVWQGLIILLIGLAIYGATGNFWGK